MKIYIVTSGEYSSYHIDGVFLDREKAEYYCAVHKYNDCYGYSESMMVEEYDAEDDNIQATPINEIKYFKIVFDNKGNVLDYNTSPLSFIEVPSKSILWENDCFIRSNNDVVVKVKADTKEEAIKIGAEMRAKALAEKFGL